MSRRGARPTGPPPPTGLLQRINDEHAIIAWHAFVRFAEGRRIVIANHAAEAGNHGDILFAVDSIAHDAALVAEAIAVVPQFRPGFRIVGMDGATTVGHEDQIAG